MGLNYNYHIINGRVIDPFRNIDRQEDIFIRGSKIVEAPTEPFEAKEVIDAAGCLVLPGLIDFHAHLNHTHSDIGIHPDLMTLPNGVTSAVDAGSTGSANFEGFYKNVVCASEITIKSFINVSAVGITTQRYTEDPNPELYDAARLHYMFERYPHQLLGLKLRIGKPFSKEYGITPISDSKKLAKELNTALCMHVVHPGSPYSDMLSSLENGDILCHCFQADGDYTILDQNGRVQKCVREARERGVIFDGALARASYSFDIMQKALDDGFMPDIISTDAVSFTVYRPIVFNLLYTMARCLAVKMPLLEVIRAVTATPARLMGMEGVLGTLGAGALADVAIVKIREAPIVFQDQFGNNVSGDKLFLPQMTIKAGKTAYMNIDFAL